MGAISEAMARACTERGVTIRANAGVAEIVLRNGRAAGVVTEAGERFEARAVASAVHPKFAFEKLVDPAALPEASANASPPWRSASGVLRINVALAELPSFACLPGHGAAEHHAAGIVIAPSLGYMERAFFDARMHGWSRAPIVELLIPSTIDDTLAPPGRHVASLFCQHVAPRLPDGRTWDEARETVADLMIDAVEAYAPGFRASIIGRKILSPLDLERDFGLVGGDIFHGVLAPDQLYSARPALGHADYRSPVAGLYMCGFLHPSGRRRQRPAGAQRRPRDRPRLPPPGEIRAIVNGFSSPTPAGGVEPGAPDLYSRFP